MILPMPNYNATMARKGQRMTPKPKKRWVLLEEWAKAEGWTRLAEIGVWKGTTFIYLLEHCPRLTVYGVDIWDAYFNHGAKRERVVSQAEQEANYRLVCERARPHGGRAVIIKARSVDAAQGIADGSLDCVFIDADHTEEAVTGEIRAWRPKIRAGGLLSGHDARVPGVRAAINAMAPGWTQYDNDVWGLRV